MGLGEVVDHEMRGACHNADVVVFPAFDIRDGVNVFGLERSSSRRGLALGLESYLAYPAGGDDVVFGEGAGPEFVGEVWR